MKTLLKSYFLFGSCLLPMAASAKYLSFVSASGELPEGARACISEYLGNYSATYDALFSHKVGNVQLVLQNNELKLEANYDVIGPRCQPGRLLRVDCWTNKASQVRVMDATFAIDPADCGNSVRANSVEFGSNYTLFGKRVYQVRVNVPHRQYSGHPSLEQDIVWDLTPQN